MGGKRILLIRHAKTTGNEECRFQGNNDTPLSELGLRQAELLRERVQSLGIEIVYSSPLLRAKRTAQIAFPSLGINEDVELIERDFGILNGLLLENAKKVHADAEEFYHGRKEHLDLEGVETIEQLRERSFRAFQRIAGANAGKRIAIVSHMVWIKSLLSRIANVPYSEIQKHRITTTAISFVNSEWINGGWKFEIEEIGNAAHLEISE